MNWRMPFTTHTKHQLARGQQPQRTKLVPVKTWQRTQILAEGIAHPLLSKQWDLHKLQDRTYFLKTRNKYFIHYGLELNKKFLLGRLLGCFLQDLLHFLQKQMVPLASAATRLLGGRDWGSEKRGREARQLPACARTRPSASWVREMPPKPWASLCLELAKGQLNFF